MGVNGFLGLIQAGRDLVKYLKLDSQDAVIAIDVFCTNCELWIKCQNSERNYDWVEVESDDVGYTLKFSTRLHYWGFAGLGKWWCDFHDRKKGKRINGFDVYGGYARKNKVNLYRIDNSRIYNTPGNVYIERKW